MIPAFDRNGGDGRLSLSRSLGQEFDSRILGALKDIHLSGLCSLRGYLWLGLDMSILVTAAFLNSSGDRDVQYLRESGLGRSE